MQEWYRSVQQMIDWLEEHLGDSPSLPELARAVGYSPCDCSTIFRDVTGMSMRKYIARRRLARAVLALRDTDARILDIAISCGYSSQEALMHLGQRSAVRRPSTATRLGRWPSPAGGRCSPPGIIAKKEAPPCKKHFDRRPNPHRIHPPPTAILASLTRTPATTANSGSAITVTRSAGSSNPCAISPTRLSPATQQAGGLWERSGNISTDLVRPPTTREKFPTDFPAGMSR